MKKLRLLVILLSVSFLFAGCSSNEKITSETIENPTAEEILADNPEADIFRFKRIIYSIAEDVEWVNKQDLTPKEKVTVITKQTTDGGEFEGSTATKLPVGTTIYQSAEDGRIYIAVVEDKEIPYLGMIEG